MSTSASSSCFLDGRLIYTSEIVVQVVRRTQYAMLLSSCMQGGDLSRPIATAHYSILTSAIPHSRQLSHQDAVSFREREFLLCALVS